MMITFSGLSNWTTVKNIMQFSLSLRAILLENKKTSNTFACFSIAFDFFCFFRWTYLRWSEKREIFSFCFNFFVLRVDAVCAFCLLNGCRYAAFSLKQNFCKSKTYRIENQFNWLISNTIDNFTCILRCQTLF